MTKQVSTMVAPTGISIEALDQGDNIICATEPNDYLDDDMAGGLMLAEGDENEELLTVNLTPSGRGKPFKFSEAAEATSRSAMVHNSTATPKNDTGRLSNIGRGA